MQLLQFTENNTPVLRDAGVTKRAILQGAAVLSRETGRSPSELKNSVTSPGGTTAEGLFMLEKYAVKSAILEAVKSARMKSQQLK